MDEPSAPVRMRSRGRQSMRRPHTRMTHYVGNQGPVSPLRDPVLMLRRRTLVNGLFTYVEEIQNLDSGYALRFRRSHDQDDLEALIGIIADYIIFESRNAPELTFEIVEESHDKSFWLQVWGLRPECPNATSTSIRSDSTLSSLA